MMDIILLDSVETFLHKLNPKELAKTIRTIELLEQFGNNLAMPHSRYMTDGILELRVRGMRGIRIFYCFHNEKAVLLHACIKKTTHTPPRELQRALKAKQDLQ